MLMPFFPHLKIHRSDQHKNDSTITIVWKIVTAIFPMPQKSTEVLQSSNIWIATKHKIHSFVGKSQTVLPCSRLGIANNGSQLTAEFLT